MTATETKQDNRSESQAKCQLECIREMVANLDGDDSETAQETIQEDALSVQVRSAWYSPGDSEGAKPAEYEILLCTGGPACRIIGDLSEHGEPESARIEHQDWGTPWTEYRMDSDEEKDVVRYAQCFYFGD